MSRSELSRTSVAFLYFFTVITSYYVLRAIRTGEFLSFIGPTKKPWADILVALLMLPCVRGYHVLVDRLPRRSFIALSQTLFAVQLLGFGALQIVSTPFLSRCLGRLGEFFSLLPSPSVLWSWVAASRGVWSAALFYVWVAIFNLFMVTMCWSAINDVFREGAARRRYGIISAGGPLGGMAGGSLTAIFVGRIQPGGMLLVSAFFVFVCVGLGHLLLSMRDDERAPREDASSREPGAGEALSKAEEQGPDEDGELERYARLIARIVALAIVVASIFNYQFNVHVKALVPGRTEMTALYGSLDMALNLVALFTGLLLTPWVLNRWGPGVGLRILPGLYAFACLVLVFVAPFWFLVVTGVLASGLTYSLNKASQEVLYVPTGRQIKYKAKSFIDTFLFRFAGASSAVFILLVGFLTARPGPWLYGAGTLVCLLWWGAVAELSRRYEALGRKKVDSLDGGAA